MSIFDSEHLSNLNIFGIIFNSFIDLEPEDAAVFMKNARAAGINVHPEQGCKTDKKPVREKTAKTEKAEKNTLSGKSDKKSSDKPRKKPRSVSALRNWVADISEEMESKEFRSSKGKKRKK